MVKEAKAATNSDGYRLIYSDANADKNHVYGVTNPANSLGPDSVSDPTMHGHFVQDKTEGTVTVTGDFGNIYINQYPLYRMFKEHTKWDYAFVYLTKKITLTATYKDNTTKVQETSNDGIYKVTLATSGEYCLSDNVYTKEAPLLMSGVSQTKEVASVDVSFDYEITRALSGGGTDTYTYKVDGSYYVSSQKAWYFNVLDDSYRTMFKAHVEVHGRFSNDGMSLLDVSGNATGETKSAMSVESETVYRAGDQATNYVLTDYDDAEYMSITQGTGLYTSGMDDFKVAYTLIAKGENEKSKVIDQVTPENKLTFADMKEIYKNGTDTQKKAFQTKRLRALDNDGNEDDWVTSYVLETTYYYGDTSTSLGTITQTWKFTLSGFTVTKDAERSKVRVARGEEAVFAVDVTGNDTAIQGYRYAWYQVESSGTEEEIAHAQSKSLTVTIDDYAAKYKCVVTAIYDIPIVKAVTKTVTFSTVPKSNYRLKDIGVITDGANGEKKTTGVEAVVACGQTAKMYVDVAAYTAYTVSYIWSKDKSWVEDSGEEPLAVTKEYSVAPTYEDIVKGMNESGVIEDGYDEWNLPTISWTYYLTVQVKDGEGKVSETYVYPFHLENGVQLSEEDVPGTMEQPVVVRLSDKKAVLPLMKMRW